MSATLLGDESRTSFVRTTTAPGRDTRLPAQTCLVGTQGPMLQPGSEQRFSSYQHAQKRCFESIVHPVQGKIVLLWLVTSHSRQPLCLLSTTCKMSN